MQIKMEGFVEPDSITGMLVAADLQHQQAISQLPPDLRDVLIEKAILAFHQDHDPLPILKYTTDTMPGSSGSLSLMIYGRSLPYIMPEEILIKSIIGRKAF